MERTLFLQVDIFIVNVLNIEDYNISILSLMQL